jgi:hypothetical protein
MCRVHTEPVALQEAGEVGALLVYLHSLLTDDDSLLVQAMRFEDVKFAHFFQ